MNVLAETAVENGRFISTAVRAAVFFPVQYRRVTDAGGRRSRGLRRPGRL